MTDASPTNAADPMRDKRFLVIGATGQVGSKIAGRLAERGYDVTAMVRGPGAKIEDPYNGVIKYVLGDLSDEASIRAAVAGMDVVISTANGIVPQKKADTASSVNKQAERLIDICEEAGVRRFAPSSVPTFKNDKAVPELEGKRRLERRLARSTMQATDGLGLHRRELSAPPRAPKPPIILRTFAMKLYSLPLSPFSARIRLAIYRKGLDVAIVPPPEGTKSEAYLALNPMGQVPTLELDSGVALAESSVILEYLEDAHPTPALRPTDPELAARMRLLLKLPDSYFVGAPRILLGMRNPADRKAERVDPAMANLHDGLSYTERYIGAGPWAVGDAPTLADCALVPVLNMCRVVSMVYARPDLISRYPNLGAYWAAAQEDEINARVIEEQMAVVRQMMAPPVG